MMKELAVFKLGKSLLAKAGEKFAAKKKVWAEQAALSKEETLRREVEFKEDFNVLKETIAQGTAKAKVEAKKGMERASKMKEEIQTKIEEKQQQKAQEASTHATVSKETLTPKDEKPATKVNT